MRNIKKATLPKVQVSSKYYIGQIYIQSKKELDFYRMVKKEYLIISSTNLKKDIIMRLFNNLYGIGSHKMYQIIKYIN